MTVSGGELADVVQKRYGNIDYEWGISSASTDFVSRVKTSRGNTPELEAFRREISPTVCALSVFHILFTDECQ